jgi:hypothetical protein
MRKLAERLDHVEASGRPTQSEEEIMGIIVGFVNQLPAGLREQIIEYARHMAKLEQAADQLTTNEHP